MSTQTQCEAPTSLISALQARAPKWALGIAVVLVAASTSIVSVYIVSKDEVRQYIGWKTSAANIETTKLADDYTDTLKTVLSLVDTNSAQITELSKALGAAQQQNAVLADRVAALEKFLQLAKGDLEICESKLRLCKKD